MQGWEKHETVILINKWEETSVFTLYRRQSSRKYPQYFGIRFHETANLVPWQFSARWSNSTHSHCSFLFLNSFDTWLTSWKKKKFSSQTLFSFAWASFLLDQQAASSMGGGGCQTGSRAGVRRWLSSILTAIRWLTLQETSKLGSRGFLLSLKIRQQFLCCQLWLIFVTLWQETLSSRNKTWYVVQKQLNESYKRKHLLAPEWEWTTKGFKNS